ncbi:MAG TPA: PLP-dependent cysteine synthase family protein [Candidatus Polarisedimenticolia bacterium]|nr:PLP-dependent cysteine synthase family protein [Candidatus Polarisedimenticolia bacterium]
MARPERVCDSILDTIGDTPLVRIRRMNPEPGVVILAKLEGFNPMGSVKERIALRIVEEAERRGELRPGMTLLESSSGNTGIGLAMVGAVKGYPVVVTMAQKVSVERRQILKALGASIVFTSPEGGSDEAWDLADRLHAENPGKYFRIGQYVNPDNVRAHYEGTAEEVWRQTGGRIDWLVLTLGTCGTLVGMARRLKELNGGLRVVSVEPQTAHTQQGLRNMTESRVPVIMDWSLVDERMTVTDEDAWRTARELASKEGIFAGISSGTAMFAALHIARRITTGQIVTLLPDRGEKYLSTSLFPRGPDPS